MVLFRPPSSPPIDPRSDLSTHNTSPHNYLWTDENQLKTIASSTRKEPYDSFSEVFPSRKASGVPDTFCDTCKRPIDMFHFMDRNYFQLLNQTILEPCNLLVGKRQLRNIPVEAFNQGYYKRFFRQGRRLGRGARGTVFLTQHVLENEALGEYAIKKIPVGDDVTWLLRFLKEVHILETLKHPNIISYKHAWLEIHQPSPFSPAVPSLFILMEYANGGSLEDLVTSEVLEFSNLNSPLKNNTIKKNEKPKPSNRLPISDILYLFMGICKGLEYLHAHRIIHRDIKPSNIVLNYPVGCVSRPEILITDFGECDTFADCFKNRGARTGATGTIEFVAPELLRQSCRDESFLFPHSTATDMWSLGMILYYLLDAGGLPYPNIDDVDLLRLDMLSLKGINLSLEMENIPRPLKNLLLDMLSLDPSNRPSIGQTIERVNSIYQSLPVSVDQSILFMHPSTRSIECILGEQLVFEPESKKEISNCKSIRYFNPNYYIKYGYLICMMLVYSTSALSCYPLSPSLFTFIFISSLFMIRKYPTSLSICILVYGSSLYFQVWPLCAT